MQPDFEQDLRESIHQVQSVFDYFPAGIGFSSITGHRLYVNPEGNKFTNFDTQEIINSQFAHHFTKTDFLRAKNTYQQVMKTGKPIEEFAYNYIDSNSDDHWFIVSIFPVLSTQGQVLGGGIIANEVVNQEVVYANRIVGELARNIRPIITTIEENIKKLEPSNAEESQYLELITYSATQIHNLVDDALAAVTQGGRITTHSFATGYELRIEKQRQSDEKLRLVNKQPPHHDPETLKTFIDRFQILLGHCPDPWVVLDETATYCAVGEYSMSRLTASNGTPLDLKVDHFLGKKMGFQMTEEDRNHILALYEKVMYWGVPLEGGIFHPIGLKDTFLATMQPLRNSAGRVIGALSICKNLTNEHIRTVQRIAAAIRHMFKNPLSVLLGGAEVWLEERTSSVNQSLLRAIMLDALQIDKLVSSKFEI